MNTLPATLTPAIDIQVHDAANGLVPSMVRLEAYMARAAPFTPLSLHPAWLGVMARGLNHTPYGLEATEGGKTRGFLVLAYVKSFLFARFLVSLPHLNKGGALPAAPATSRKLIDRAVMLADELKVRYLELRHEQ